MGIKKLTGNGGAKPSKRKPGTKAKEVKKAKKVVTTAKDFGKPQVATPIMPVSAEKAKKIKKAKALAKAPVKKAEVKETLSPEIGFWQDRIKASEARTRAWEISEKEYLANLKELARRKSPEGKEARETLKRLEEIAKLGKEAGFSSLADRKKVAIDFTQAKKSFHKNPEIPEETKYAKTEIKLPSLARLINEDKINAGLALAATTMFGNKKKAFSNKCKESASEFLRSIWVAIETPDFLASAPTVQGKTKIEQRAFQSHIVEIDKTMGEELSASDIVLLSIIATKNSVAKKLKMDRSLASPGSRKLLLELLIKEDFERKNPYQKAFEEFNITLSNPQEINRLALIYLGLEKGVLGFDEKERNLTVLAPIKEK